MSCNEVMKRMEHKQEIKKKAYLKAEYLYARIKQDTKPDELSDYLRHLCNKLMELRTME